MGFAIHQLPLFLTDHLETSLSALIIWQRLKFPPIVRSSFPKITMQLRLLNNPGASTTSQHKMKYWHLWWKMSKHDLWRDWLGAKKPRNRGGKWGSHVQNHPPFFYCSHSLADFIKDIWRRDFILSFECGNQYYAISGDDYSLNVILHTVTNTE